MVKAPISESSTSTQLATVNQRPNSCVRSETAAVAPIAQAIKRHRGLPCPLDKPLMFLLCST